MERKYKTEQRKIKEHVGMPKWVNVSLPSKIYIYNKVVKIEMGSCPCCIIQSATKMYGTIVLDLVSLS